MGAAMTTQETDHTEGLPPHCSSYQQGGGHRRPHSRDGRTVSSAVFVAACTAFGLAVATVAALAAPRSGRAAVFLAVQMGATLLVAALGLMRRTRRTTDSPPGVHWTAAGGHQGAAVTGGGAIPDAG